MFGQNDTDIKVKCIKLQGPHILSSLSEDVIQDLIVGNPDDPEGYLFNHFTLLIFDYFKKTFLISQILGLEIYIQFTPCETRFEN